MSRRSSQWRSGRLHKAHKIGRRGIALDTVLYWVIGIAAVAVVLYLLTRSGSSTRSSLEKCEGGFYAALGKEARCHLDGEAPSADGEYYYQFVGMGKKAGCDVGKSCYLKIPINENPVSKDEIEAVRASSPAMANDNCKPPVGEWTYSINNGKDCGPVANGGTISVTRTSDLAFFYAPKPSDNACQVDFANGAVATYAGGSYGETCIAKAGTDGKVKFSIGPLSKMYDYADRSSQPFELVLTNVNTGRTTFKLISTSGTKTAYVVVDGGEEGLPCPKASDAECRRQPAYWVIGSAGVYTKDSDKHCFYYPTPRPPKCRYVVSP